MDSKLFKCHAKWEYNYELEDSLRLIFNYLVNSNIESVIYDYDEINKK
jgi:hypothetical protein